jgi:hypothetical protein
MNLVGYISRDRVFPNPLISVGKEDDEFFAFYPSGDKVKLRNVTSDEMLRARDTFIAVDPSTADPVPALAFGINPEVIVSGDHSSVVQSLHNYLASTSAQQLSSTDREVIGQFLYAIREAAKKISASELQELASSNTILHVFMYRRRLRRRPGSAFTFLVQLCYKHRQKTLYRKGVPIDKSLHDVFIPRQTSDVLMQKQVLAAACA